MGRNSVDATNASRMRRARAEGRLCLRLAILLRTLPFFVDRPAEADFLPVLCDAALRDMVFFDVDLGDPAWCDAADELLCVVEVDDVLA